MSDDEMRVAIAEACGWKEHPSKQGWIWLGEQPQPSGLNQPPDYLNDLNAMHSAVMSRPMDWRMAFQNNLQRRAVALLRRC